MVTGLSRATPRKWLVATFVALVVAVGSSPSRVGPPLSRALDALFAVVAATFPDDAPAPPVDLHDGRSPVPAPWRERFAAFAAADRDEPAGDDAVVFVGSSSIEFWRDLATQFPTHAVVQRGLAGATMADCLRHVDRLVLPSRPRTVVVYAGDNDLAAGVAPARIVADYQALVDRVRRARPDTRLVFVSIKPSPARAGLTPLIRRTNALMAAYAGTDRRLDYVDVFTPMLDADQRPRAELFRADGLHLAASGYALWRDAIAPHLD